MENASKALLIAGAILLSILIITLGIIVYNQAKSTAGNVNLSEYQIQVFNDKFTHYEGRNVSGKQVNNLIKSVIESNTINMRDRTGMYITLFYPVREVTATNYACSRVREIGSEMAIIYSENIWLRGDIRLIALNQNTAWFGTIQSNTNPIGWQLTPTHSLKMQDNLIYQVIMTKNETTGLIGTIVIAPTGVDF